VRKYVHTPPCRNAVPMESHSDGQRAGYFPRTLQTLLLVLRYSEPPLFIGTLRLLCGNTYLWYVSVIIYERPMTDHIRRIRQVVKSSTPRWMFKGVMREAAREALDVLRQEVDEQMEHSQYRHFSSRARGAEAMVMPWEIMTTLGASPNK
jgi:hypothetical protein